MKKRLLILSMISFSLIGLTGCNDIKQIEEGGKQVIVKLGNGETYTANDLFTNYSSTSAGASEYFNAVYDVLIRAVQDKTTQVQNYVDDEMSKFVSNCKEAASNNGTSYKTEESKALENAGVDSLGELEQLKYLEAQKTAYEDAYYEGAANKEGDGELSNLLKEYIQYYAPYHVRHILVKTSSDNSLYEGKISEDDAKNLYNVVSRLASGNETFGNIAVTTAGNGDTGSAKEYGNLGIMDINTGYVSEFKYSIYQYDTLYNTDAKANVVEYNKAQKDRKIGTGDYATDYEGTSLIPESVDTTKLSVNRIPYNAFVEINKYAKTTTLTDGTNYKDGKEKYFPRNILFNEYLNDHRLGVIFRGDNADVQESTRFTHIDGLSATADKKDDVLTDEDGRPILVTRAGTSGDSGYQGIHFIICQRSPFVKVNKSVSGTEFSTLIDSLVYYYDTTIYNSDDSGSDLPTDKYVTFLNTTRNEYLDKVNKLKSTIKGFDSFMNYRIFEKALSDANAKYGKVTFGSFVDEDGNTISIESLLKKYVTSNRENAAYSAQEAYNKSWENYELLLQSQSELSVLKVPHSEIAEFDKVR